MAETSGPEKEKACIVCQAKSQDRVLLCGTFRDKEVWVCVRCLPTVIHGAH